MGKIFQKDNVIEVNNSSPKNIKLLSVITNDSFAYIILSNTFTVFESINHIIFLIYCNTNNCIVCYDLKSNQKINEIKNNHEEFITNFSHYLDVENNRDLIMSISLDDNNIRVWNLINWECILNIQKINNDGYLYSACFLKENNKLYIITSNFNLLNTSELIKIFDFNGNKVSEISESNDITYIIKNYYDKNSSKNFIITGNLGYVKSYDFKKRELYHKYSDKDSGTHLSVLINDNDNLLKLIESCFDGKIRIWNFHTGKLLTEIKVNKWLTGICILNSDNLFVGCYDRTIKLIDLKNKNIVKSLEGHKDWVLTIKKINHPKYGTCLISQGRRNDQIKMWMIES